MAKQKRAKQGVGSRVGVDATPLEERVRHARRRRMASSEYLWIYLRENQRQLRPASVVGPRTSPSRMDAATRDKLRDLCPKLNARAKIVAAPNFKPSDYLGLSEEARATREQGWPAWEILPYLTWLTEYVRESKPDLGDAVEGALREVRVGAEAFLRHSLGSRSELSVEHRAVLDARITELFRPMRLPEHNSKKVVVRGGNYDYPNSVRFIESRERDREYVNAGLEIPSAWSPLPPPPNLALSIVSQLNAQGTNPAKILDALMDMGLAASPEAQHLRETIQGAVEPAVQPKGSNLLRERVTAATVEAVSVVSPNESADAAYGAAAAFIERAATLAFHSRQFTDQRDWHSLAGSYALALLAWFDLTHLLTPAIRAKARQIYPPGSPPISIGKLKGATVIEGVADRLGVYLRNVLYQGRAHPLDPEVDETRAAARQRLGVNTSLDGMMQIAEDWKRLSPDDAETALILLRFGTVEFETLRIQLDREAQAVLTPPTIPGGGTADSEQVIAELKSAIKSLTVQAPKTRRGLQKLAQASTKDSQVIALLNDGTSYRDVAAKCGVGKSTVERIAKAYGLTGHKPDAVPDEGTLDENLSIRVASRKRGKT